MKKMVTIAIILALSFTLHACGKKSNPLGANDPDKPQPTATPAPTPQPGKSNITVHTTFSNGTVPLPNLNCSLKFDSSATTWTGTTDLYGYCYFAADASGNYTVTIPAQGDILQSQLSGYCARTSSNVEFQAGGVISVTPTVLTYGYAGGSQQINVGYSQGAYSLAIKPALSLTNLPASWTTAFNPASIAAGGQSICTLTIPQNSSQVPSNVCVQAAAVSNRINLSSTQIGIAPVWSSYGDVKVTVTYAGSDYAGASFVITDSAGKTYNGASQVGGTTIRLTNTGNFSVHLIGYGPINDQTQTGTVAQGGLATVSFNAMYADVLVKVEYAGSDYVGASFVITDSAGQTYNGTSQVGGMTVRIQNTGAFSVNVQAGGPINAMTQTGTVAQGGLATVTFNAMYADVKVLVKNGTADYSGVNFTVTDSTNATYTGTSQSGGTIVRIKNTGNFTVSFAAQGSVAAMSQNGTATQASVSTITFNVGSADLNISVQHNTTAYTNLPMQITDANGTVQNINTDNTGNCRPHLAAIGAYTVTIPDDTADGILMSQKAGTISQGQVGIVNFTGKEPYVWPSNLSQTVSKSYIGYNTGTVALQFQGDINYLFNMTSSISGGGISSITFGSSPLSPSTNSSGVTVNFKGGGTPGNYTQTINAVKPGQNGFTSQGTFVITMQ